MKHLGIFILGALLLASCATNKRAAYIQQVQTDIPTAIEQDYQIRIKPLDRLTVTINSKDPELAAPFNAASSYNSLNGLLLLIGIAAVAVGVGLTFWLAAL